MNIKLPLAAIDSRKGNRISINLKKEAKLRISEELADELTTETVRPNRVLHIFPPYWTACLCAFYIMISQLVQHP